MKEGSSEWEKYVPNEARNGGADWNEKYTPEI